MGLSYDIISEFVKVTNGNKEKPKEGIVYATIVQGSDGKYVKIDGSDLLTPADTTTDIEDGERVTVMIKDHRATVTGNVTAPSASGNRVDKVVETVTEQIGVFETVVADKVSVNELEAYKATIENLIVGKADIEDLEATNAVIENLKVKDAEIENLVADKATIEDLEAVNATIENLKVKDAEIENAVIDNLEATKAEIGILEADFAQIKTLVSGNLTSDNILSFNITADKVTMEDAFIKDAMIDTVNASKINAGKINTNSVSIGSEDGGMLITGATQQFTDKNGNVRIQIGRDTSGDFTFALYGEDGQGQLINQNGITASAIADGLIVNDMVSDNAAISGGKLDISSVVTEINNDNTTTIKSNKIYLDEQNQSLEVAFKSLKTQVDTIKDIDSDLTTITDKIQSNTSKIEANKSSISTLLAEDAAIKKQVTDLEGNVVETTNTLTSKYTTLQQNLDGFKTTVNNTYATKTSVNDVKNNLSSNYSTTSAMNSAINQKVDEITASVSSTYATKNEVKTIDDNIKANYSTTEQMTSAISVAKNDINLGISKVYETKTNVESKISSSASSTLTNAKSYADTKKSEAISTASSDATSKANNALTSAKSYTDTAKNALNTEIGKKANSTDVYTKTQTYTKTEVDSAIKLSKDAIELGVSNKYETKANVETKVSSTLNSAKSYSDTKKTEAINAAATDATSKVNAAKSELNTAIGKKANTADVYSKAEVYTKSQTDSAINIAKDAINLGVSQTYETKANVESKINGIQIGGRNLAQQSHRFNKGRGGTGITSMSNSDGSISVTASSGNENWFTDFIVTSAGIEDGFNEGDTFTISFIASSKNTTKIPTIYIKSGMGYYPMKGTLGPKDSVIYYTGIWKKANFISIHLGFSGIVGTINFKKWKLEKGNKATDWSPAPEDITANITTAKTEAINSANNTLTTTIANYYTKTQTDSQIKVAKDAINLGVSNTYETKANVETKVSSTLNSAKSYADTKKSEAISTASSDATSKANNALTSAKSYTDTAKNALNTEIGKKANSADVYTKTQTYTKTEVDSAIKLNKDAIELGVSQKYETKTSVTSQVSTALTNAKSYADAKKSEAITGARQIADTRNTNENPQWYMINYPKQTITEFKNSSTVGLSNAGSTYGAVTTVVPWYDSSGGYPIQTYRSNANNATYERRGTSNTAWGAWRQIEDANSSQAKATQAKNDAITSANNTLNTTIANYYTKSQTDSQINVAKNAITQSVSSTYETKTNVTNKINGVNSSISSLQTRMNTAEQKITDTAITNTVKQNFYTKTETDGKVTTVQNNMQSSITQLSNQIATKVDVNGVLSTIQQNPNSIQIGFNKISNALTIDSTGMIAKAQNGNKYYQLGYNGITMYNPANGTHEWGRISAINSKFTVASNGNSSGLSLGHFVSGSYVEDILCSSTGVIHIQRQMNHNGILYNNYGHIIVRQSGQGGWEIIGRSDSQSIKPGGANQGAIGSNTQYINQSWIANRHVPSSLEVKHLSHYIEDNDCITLVNGVKPARYFYKEYDEDGNDITTFTSKTSQLGLIYEDIRECAARDLITNEDDKGINLYGMVSVLWGAVRNLNTRLNEAEYEIVLLNEELERIKNNK